MLILAYDIFVQVTNYMHFIALFFLFLVALCVMTYILQGLVKERTCIAYFRRLDVK